MPNDKPLDIDHSLWNKGNPNEWAQDFMAHVSMRDIDEAIMTQWFQAAMRAAVVNALGGDDNAG